MEPTLNMQPAKKSYGALIAVIVILMLIVIGGLYFLGQRIDNSSYMNTTTNEGDDAITASLQSQSSSDDLSSIQSDLNATNMDNLDQGAAAIGADAAAE